MKKLAIFALVTTTGLAAGCSWRQSDQSRAGERTDSEGRLASAQEIKSIGKIETVAEFNGAMPTGVTVSHDGRIFVNFPRWGDQVDYTVAELKDGQPVAYPDAEINQYDVDKVGGRLVSVQSVVVDPKNRLWILDTGSLHMGPPAPGGAKLVGVDLSTNQVFKTITFPGNVALATSYLNDVRFDLRRGTGGTAYITDSGTQGPNGIVVVDLDSGRSWRKLSGHWTVRADPNFASKIPGDSIQSEPLMNRPAPGVATPLTIGSDGIAISADGKRLFYCPLASHRLHSVSTDTLADESVSDEQVAATVMDHGPRDFASDGLESDAAGNLYLTDYQNNAVRRRTADGNNQVVAKDPRMIWPDTLSVAADGYIYFTANQLNRQKQFHEDQDLRQKPYFLFRTKINATPVMLK